MTSALRPEPRPCDATRACSCVVSEPRISDCSSDSASAGETPSASASRRALQQHLALAAEVTRRLAGRALDLGDLLAEGLPLGDELQQFTVDDVEPGAEFFEGFHAVTALWTVPFTGPTARAARDRTGAGA